MEEDQIAPVRIVLVNGVFFAISVCGSQFLDKVSAQARELKSTSHFSSPPEAGCFSATIVRIYRRATGAETPLSI